MMLTIFFLTLIFIIYTFVGYPLIVYLLSNNIAIRSRADAQENSKHFDLTILMIVCNEEKIITKKIENLLEIMYFDKQPKILIVDDNSTDATVVEVLKYDSDRIDLIKIPQRLGKANGINVAMKQVQTPLLMMVDVRQEVDLDAAEKLSKWFELDSNVGAVSGELGFKSDGENEFSKGIDGYWRYEKFIRKCESRFASVPGVTGAIYMLRAQAFKPMPSDTILDDVLIPMNAIDAGYKVGFEEEARAWDFPSNNQINERRRKIRTISGNFQLLFRNPKWLLPTQHAIWWQYLSHKVMRLFVPFIALLNYLIAVDMAYNSNEVAFVYVVLFAVALSMYPLSHVMPLIQKNKFSRLWISFLTLNWFSVLGLYDYLFSNRNQSWK
jgi:cellulose synthase/poly-beta-1,6-N-acetylglucosamine synthase-like glycosyltransferase